MTDELSLETRSLRIVSSAHVDRQIVPHLPFFGRMDFGERELHKK